MPESAIANPAIANPAMANPAMAKSKRQIVSSIEDGPTEYDRENYHSHLIEQYKLYVEMVDRLSARRVLVNNSFITLPQRGRTTRRFSAVERDGFNKQLLR